MLSEHLEWRSQNMPILKRSCLNEFTKGKLYMRGRSNRCTRLWYLNIHGAVSRV